MNANVWDVNDTREYLVRARVALNPGRPTDDPLDLGPGDPGGT